VTGWPWPDADLERGVGLAALELLGAQHTFRIAANVLAQVGVQRRQVELMACRYRLRADKFFKHAVSVFFGYAPILNE
jgi:hypothetical protein